MRRMLITVGVTVTGTAAVLAFDPSLERAARLAAPDDADQAAAPAGNLAAFGGQGSSSADPGTGHPAEGAPTASDWTDGPVVDTPAGEVQVRVGLDAGRIADVQLLRGPHGTRRSAWLTRHAAMVLRAEVLQAQSADVDMVSGATYTSAGYLQSLQAALDTADEREGR